MAKKQNKIINKKTQIKQDEKKPSQMSLFNRILDLIKSHPLVAIILIFGILIRLTNFHILPIDAHSMRQEITDNIAYNFAFHDPNILLPQQSLIRPPVNVNAYFFMEFPAYAYIIGLLYRLFGWHVELARIFNLLLFGTSVITLYYFVKKFINEKTALFAIFFYTIIPSSIFFFGHAIHTDIFANATLLYSFALFILYREKQNRWFFLSSLLCLSLAVSSRPFILIVLPAYFFLLYCYKAQIWEYLSLGVGSVFIYGIWNLWEYYFRYIHNYWWDQSEKTWVLEGREQLFNKSTFINQLLKKNVIGEVFGKSASIMAGVGMFIMPIKRNKAAFFIFSWLIFIPVYWYIVPNGNIIHQYYANIYVIPVILAASFGLAYLYTFLATKTNKIITFILLIPLLLFFIYNGLHTTKYFYNYLVGTDLPVANDIQKVVPESSKLVFLGGNFGVPPAVFHRKAWMTGAPPLDTPATASDIEKLKDLGARYVVYSKQEQGVISTPELENLKKSLNLVYSSNWTDIYTFK